MCVCVCVYLFSGFLVLVSSSFCLSILVSGVWFLASSFLLPVSGFSTLVSGAWFLDSDVWAFGSLVLVSRFCFLFFFFFCSGEFV